jgi:hypothetical protein
MTVGLDGRVAKGRSSQSRNGSSDKSGTLSCKCRTFLSVADETIRQKGGSNSRCANHSNFGLGNCSSDVHGEIIEDFFTTKQKKLSCTSIL